LRHKYRREGNMEREAETGGGGGGEWVYNPRKAKDCWHSPKAWSHGTDSLSEPPEKENNNSCWQLDFILW
jgi:hypothetical protein